MMKCLPISPRYGWLLPKFTEATDAFNNFLHIYLFIIAILVPFIGYFWGSVKWFIMMTTSVKPQVANGSEKAMAPHSSTLAWKIPWTEEPGSLQSMGSQRVGHDWATSLSLFPFTHWRRKWQPTPVFLPGESQGWGNQVGCRLWGCTELDMTEATWQQQQQIDVINILLELMKKKSANL